jgi:hypothetical protein
MIPKLKSNTELDSVIVRCSRHPSRNGYGTRDRFTLWVRVPL